MCRKRVGDTERETDWYIDEKRGRVKAMKDDACKEAVEHLQTLSARVRAKVEHPFRVIERQFAYLRVR